jgi:hypothetical protein
MNAKDAPNLITIAVEHKQANILMILARHNIGIPTTSSNTTSSTTVITMERKEIDTQQTIIDWAITAACDDDANASEWLIFRYLVAVGIIGPFCDMIIIDRDMFRSQPSPRAISVPQGLLTMAYHATLASTLPLPRVREVTENEYNRRSNSLLINWVMYRSMVPTNYITEHQFVYALSLTCNNLVGAANPYSKGHMGDHYYWFTIVMAIHCIVFNWNNALRIIYQHPYKLHHQRGHTIPFRIANRDKHPRDYEHWDVSFRIAVAAAVLGNSSHIKVLYKAGLDFKVT